MKKDEFNKLNKPFIHQVCGNWIDLNTCLESQKDTYIAIVNGSNCKSTLNMFKEFARAFNFPNYFGENWAAFDECINDLEWISSSGYILLIREAELILKSEPKDFITLVEILNDTAMEWANGRHYDDFPTNPTPFHVIFYTDNDKKDVLTKRLGEVLTSSNFNKLLF